MTAVVSTLPTVQLTTGTAVIGLSQLTTGTAVIGLVQATTGTAVMGYVSSDPCSQTIKTNFAFGVSTTNLQLVAGVSAKKIYICNIFVTGAAAFIANLIEGTGATCVTASELAVIGSTTAAAGMSFSANSGWAQGNGAASIAVTANASSGLCFLQNAAVTVAGNISFVQQ